MKLDLLCNVSKNTEYTRSISCRIFTYTKQNRRLLQSV